MQKSRSALRCWVLTEGHTGTVNQAVGLAEAMGLQPEIKRFMPRAPWKFVPPRLWRRPLELGDAASDALTPPWPDLLISCGKRAAAPAHAIRMAAGGRCFVVQVLAPPVPAAWFDMLVLPRHDGRGGANIFVTEAAIHRVTPAKLAAARARFADLFEHLPQPRVAVLIGGSNKRHRLTEAAMTRLADQLATVCRRQHTGLMITPSRRTGAENTRILLDKLRGLPSYVWDGGGDNPYFGMLAWADAIVVTVDSVSMTSEACSTGKPVYVAALEGHSKRIAAFHRHMQARGYTRPFDGHIEAWSYAPPDDTLRAAAEVWRRVEQRGIG
ncbi:MAG: mitochondrial fission ELM1 family protein [Alphaproteobacteria bacterium]